MRADVLLIQQPLTEEIPDQSSKAGRSVGAFHKSASSSLLPHERFKPVGSQGHQVWSRGQIPIGIGYFGMAQVHR